MKKIVKRMVGVSILLIGATFMMNFLSCKKETGGGDASKKDFEIEFIRVWGKEAKGKPSVSVSGLDTPKTLEVQVTNCKHYKMEYELKNLSGSKDAKSGNASVDPFAIEKGEGKLFITLKADGFNDYEALITVKREDSSAPGIQVMLKRSEDEAPNEVVNGKEYSTVDSTVTVSVLSSGTAEMQKVSIAGSEVTLTNGGKKAEKTDVATSGNVEVVVDFEYFKQYKVSFSLKKVSPGEVPVQVLTATLHSGDDYGTSTNLIFDDSNTASIELDNIQYSCVKLVMSTDIALEATSGLEECRDDRSANYAAQPNQTDVKGIFSGRLTKEIDKDGKVTETYTPINGKTYTEYLIVGAGKVEYDFKFKANGRKETKYTVKITNTKEDKVPYAGQGAQFYVSQGYGSQFFLSGPVVWRWVTYTTLPVNGEAAFNDIANVEYMGDVVKMYFAKLNQGVPGEMYFYYNVFEDQNSKKHEFARIIGSTQGGAYFTLARVNPDGKYVDAFAAFKDFLPQALMPLQIQKTWKKIVKKGFLFQVENDLEYPAPTQQNPNAKISSFEIFYDAFNYRVQAKTYEKGQSLNIGLEQNYADMLSGNSVPIPHPFLSGEKVQLQGGGEGPKDLMIMMPTFTGAMADSIETVTYTIKKNGAEVGDWTNVPLTPSKWTKFLCLNAKNANISAEGKLVDGKSMYIFEKETSGAKNYYEIEVTIKPKNETASEVFKYRIDYKDKQTITSMSLTDSPSVDSNLFGVPVSYAEVANREVQAMFREMMGKDYARASLINR